MRNTRWRPLVVLVVLLGLVTAACGSDKSIDAKAKKGPTVRLVPQDFAESETLTQVYGQFLKAKGFTVDIQRPNGFRDKVYPALEQGKADVIIDYTGSAATFLDPKGKPSPDADKTLDRLKSALKGKKVEALVYSEAEDKNALVVLKKFADDNDLKTISDLKGIQDKVVFGGSAQCIEREDCLLGYQDPDVYGLKFKDVKTLDYGPPLVAGLKSGDLQAIQYQTTAAEIESGEVVVLEDDKELLSADNIVPVVRTEALDAYKDDLRDAINELSGKLKTEDLVKWNSSTDIDKDEPADVATKWLKENNLV